MTLVIDNTQKLAYSKPEFLDALQEFAKDAADNGNLRIVFVSSDFTVLTRLQTKTEWSRCRAVEVGEGDISEEAALGYLMGKLEWAAGDGGKTAAAREYGQQQQQQRNSCMQCADPAAVWMW